MVAILIDEDCRQSQASLNDDKAMVAKSKFPVSSSKPKPTASSSIPACTYYKRLDHITSRHYKLLQDLDVANKAHLVIDKVEEEESIVNEMASMVICDDDDNT